MCPIGYEYQGIIIWPIIGDLQNVHLELKTEVEHNADLGDGFQSQRIKGLPTSLQIIMFEVHHHSQDSLRLNTYLRSQTLMLKLSLANSGNNGRK
jgi:hypothetical protein